MEPNQKSKIQNNLEKVNARIRKAAEKVGRSEKEVELVAVTKQKSAVVVKNLLECGVHQIGESYLKEALFKIDLLQDYDIAWHMIGNIQSGKERQIAQHFQAVHSVSSLQTASELDKYAGQSGIRLPIYLEMNVSGEDSKHGWLASGKHQWEMLLPVIEKIIELPALKVMGFMTMAPYSENPEDARPFFSKLRELRDYFEKQFPEGNFKDLSMGMSGDFEVAIEEGATVVRIGSALVGPRE